ncbi:MAG: kynureninase [Vicinamibacterales bacterium]
MTIEPEALAPFYSRFRVSERVLLTGHSHQAWPDVSFEAQQQAWLDAAALADGKWSRAQEVADRVADGWRELLGDPTGAVAFGANTHELVVRWLSALPLDRRPRLVTTDGEFHSIRRQVDRLAEAGLAIVKVPARPVDTLADRLSRAADDRTAAVLVSSVLFETAEIVPGLEHVAAVAERVGASLLVDAYHHLNVVPFAVTAMGLDRAFVVGGGYKYCQMGEGNCFLRVPPGCTLRPVITGWFSEFAELAEAPEPGKVSYGAGGARFAGATYDPTAHYRAAAVFGFFREQGLTPDVLRGISRRQVARLERAIAGLDLDPQLAAVPAIPPDGRAGFLAVRTARAQQLVEALRARDIHTDARGEYLRLGPAPYVTDTQLDDAVAAMAEILRA